MILVQLVPGLPGGKWALLRPLCGHDETRVDAGSLAQGVALLDRLLVDSPGTSVGPGRASELAVSDGDRLFAAIYFEYFGEWVEGVATCRQCGSSFAVSFSLKEMTAEMDAPGSQHAVGPDQNGVYTLSDGRRFRLPTCGDQQSVIGLDLEEGASLLRNRCIVEGNPVEDPALLQAGMSVVGPVLDQELETVCPDCGVLESVRFDVQRHLLHTLAREKRFLVREVHLIALAYGWGYEEILDIPRQERRAFVALIQAERESKKGTGR